jgi:O-antigen/teichoic acid export membrane protein
MFKKFIVNSLLYGLAPQLPRLAGLFVLPLTTPFLQERDFGIFGLVTAYVGALSALQSLGFNVVVVNSFFQYPQQYKWRWRQMHGFLSLWSIVYAIILSIILFIFIPEVTLSEKLLIIFFNCFPEAFYKTTELFFYKYYQLRQEALTLSIRTIIVGFISIFFNWYAIAVLKMGFIGWMLSVFIGSSSNFLLSIYPFYFKNKFWPIFNFKVKTIKRVLNVSMPTIPHNYASYLLNGSDRVIMDNLHVPVNQIGLYNVAANFGNYFSSFVDAICVALSPMYPKLLRKNTDESQNQARYITFFLESLTLIGSFFICLWMKEVYLLLIKNKAIQTSYYLGIVMIMGYNYKAFYVSALQPLIFQGKTRVLWRISLIGGLISIFLNFALIPFFGIEMANISKFIAFMYLAFAGFYLKHNEFKYNYYPLRWLLTIISLTVIVYLLKDVDIYYKLYISLFITLGVVIAAYKFFHFKNLLFKE